jgi:hypothetical protein
MAWSENCTIAQNETVGVYVTQVRKKGYIKVANVAFGDKGPAYFSASLAAGLDGGILEVRLDSVKGQKVAAIELPRTGGWDQFKLFKAPVEGKVTGTHDLFLTFMDKNIVAGRELFNLDWWQFN